MHTHARTRGHTELVSHSYSLVQFQGSRTGADLQCYWQSVLHPLLNKQSWSRDEDKKLMRLAKQYSGRHWQQISLELGVSCDQVMKQYFYCCCCCLQTNRSPYDCILRYQQCLNPIHLKRLAPPTL